jgi:hypothetical protein
MNPCSGCGLSVTVQEMELPGTLRLEQARASGKVFPLCLIVREKRATYWLFASATKVYAKSAMIIHCTNACFRFRWNEKNQRKLFLLEAKNRFFIALRRSETAKIWSETDANKPNKRGITKKGSKMMRKKPTNAKKIRYFSFEAKKKLSLLFWNEKCAGNWCKIFLQA